MRLPSGRWNVCWRGRENEKKNRVFRQQPDGRRSPEKILQTLLNRWEGSGWNISVYCLKKEDVPSGYPRNIAFRFLLGSLRQGDGFWTRLKIKAGNKLKLLVYRHCPPSVFYRMFIRGTYDVEAAFIEGYATRIASGSPNADSRKLAWVHIDLARQSLDAAGVQECGRGKTGLPAV